MRRFAPLYVLITALAFAAATVSWAQDDAAALDAIVDGLDYRERAFEILLDRPVPMDGACAELDRAAVVAEPPEFRGQCFQLRGKVRQVTPLGEPYGAAAEWFVGPPEAAVIVYVADPLRGDDPVGEMIEARALFYKTMNMTARDGTVRTYPALVTNADAITMLDETAPAQESVLGTALFGGFAAVVVVMCGFFVVMCVIARRAKKRGELNRIQRRPGRGAHEDERNTEPAPPLPDDPAEALAVLRGGADGANGG